MDSFLAFAMFSQDTPTPALRAPASTAYPTNPLPPVIRTSGEVDMMDDE